MTRARDLSKLLGTSNSGVIDNSNITLDANEVPSLDTAKITSGTFASARIDNNSLSAITALPSGVGGTAWQSVQTTGFTAVAGRGYFCNTTSSAFTVTLPASASAGDTIVLVDYAGTFDTNALTINPNGNKIEGATINYKLSGEREGATLTFTDATQGWLVSSGVNEGTDALEPTAYSVDFLVVAGGGGGGNGGGGAGGYRNSYLTETSGGGGSSETSLTFSQGTVYTITVGAGGAEKVIGFNSLISGTGITTITSTGGGGGGSNLTTNGDGENGGSGGGGATNNSGTTVGTIGLGTANQGRDGGLGTNTGGYGKGGGGGASAVGANAVTTTGGNGGNGLASSITGSSVTRAGGGGGGSSNDGGSIGGTGTGGGGNGGSGTNAAGTAGTVNTGAGGGGASSFSAAGAAGGSGVVILRIPTANYSGTTTGSPTVTTDGSDKVIVFNASGSITG